MKRIIALALIISINAGSSQLKTASYCETLYSRYKIHPKTKSSRGWIRVLSSYDKRAEYGIIDIDKSDIYVLSECLSRDGFQTKKFTDFMGDIKK